MSVSSAISALADILYTINPFPEEPPRQGCIFTDPREAMVLADFPSIVITEAVGTQHNWIEEALGLARHDYQLTLYIFLGIRQTPLPELHARALPWSEALMTVLAAHITLGGVVNQIGYGGDPKLFTYKLGPIPWGMADGDPLIYWGITATLPITEKIPMEMAA